MSSRRAASQSLDTHRRTGSMSGSGREAGQAAQGMDSPGSVGGDDEDSIRRRATRSKVGPLPPNGPTNPLFPPLPPKVPRARKNGGGSIGGGGSFGAGGGASAPVSPVVGHAEPVGTTGKKEGKERSRSRSAKREESALDVEEGEPLPPTNAGAEDAAMGDADVNARRASTRQEERPIIPDTDPEAETKPADSLAVDPADTARNPSPTSGLSELSGETETAPRRARRTSASASASAAPDAASTKSSRSSARRAAAPSRERERETAKERSERETLEAKHEADEEIAEEQQAGEGAEEVLDDRDVTRCVCGKDDIDVMMIQCDMCNAWQHGACVGIWGDHEAPEEYFCDICRPGLHAPLRRFHKLREKRGEPWSPPTPTELQHHHYPSDRIKPSQSKRWADPVIKASATTAAHAAKGGAHVADKRSHHRKPALSPPVSSTSAENRRARGMRGTPVEPAAAESSASASHGPGTSKRKGSANVLSRRAPSETPSDTPPAAHPPARKRNTMNSRDAAYEKAIAESMLEAGLQPPKDADMQDLHDDHEADRRPQKRRRELDAEEDKDDDATKRSHKKKRDEEETVTKSKHANQYTYRTPAITLKGPAVSPVKKSNLAGDGPLPKNKTTAAKDRGGTPMTAPKESSKDIATHYVWNLPDHLSSFNHLLPSENPLPLELITPRPAKQLSKEIAAGQSIKVESHTEPPHKVRYPPKRITVGEMKKRARSVLEYVGRIQLEEGKRIERATLLGIVKPEITSAAEGDVAMADPAVPTDEVQVMEAPTAPPPKPPVPTVNTAQLMDELTRDLIKFQEHFEAVPATIPNGNAVPASGSESEPIAAEV